MNKRQPANPLYIGYVLKRYPRFSETFVVNEILNHERAGVKIDIFALGPVQETHFQDVISQVRAPVYRLNHKQRNPEVLWDLLQTAFTRLPDFAGKLAEAKGSIHEVAQAVSIALEIQTRGIRHLHAHFGTQATTVARQAAIFAGITYTFTAHAKDIYYPYEESTELAVKMRDAFGTVTVSDYNLSYLKEQYGNDASKVVRIYNGMDLNKFSYVSYTRRKPHILAVGRFVAKKGFNVLLDALSLLKRQKVPVSCTLVGSGVLQTDLEARIKALGIEDMITLVGPMPQSDVIGMMRQANMVVAPCIISEEGDRDGLPTVLLESMALGTPVISTQVAGIPELVKDRETGLCVAPQNPQALAEGIKRLLNDQDLCRTLSKNARALIEREYDEEHNAARLRELFNSAIRSYATV